MNHFLGVKEDNFTYPVKWKVTYQYTTTNIGKVIVKDKNDFFKVADNTKEYITYKNINIINTKELKGTIIKVINNDTDEVLYVYNENNFGEVYEFPKGVSSIRLESDTHEINVRYDYEVRITKEIDNEKMVNAVSLAKFNTYTQLTSGFEMVDGRPENTGINRITHQENANLTPRISKTYITLDKNSYEPKNMADTTIPMNIKINHCSDNDEPSLCNVWKKETHLLIFSENITDVELPTLNSYSGYSLEKTMIGDKIGVKVTYNNETSSNLTTNLNIKVTINPKSLSGKNYIEVYSADEVAYKYQNPKSDIYDINGNGNVIDQVNYTSTSFDLIVPKELVTGAQIKNYDSKDSVTISPLIADVEIMDGKQEADMEIFMINNSTNAVDGIVTMGRIGYVGNTYQMSSGELGTEYNTNIKSAIQVPDEIKDKTKVYYSDKENPTKDLEDAENNWIENPNDFSTIKNYMIVVDPDYSLESGKELAFTYKISIPNKRANLMKVSYFNHGVYFNYLTDNGRYATSASSGKLGVRISRKVNLNITNTKIFSTNPIKGSIYKVESEEGEVFTGTTDALGKVTISGLYAEKNYKLIQASINSKYVKDEEEKTFKIVLDENNKATIEKTGIYKSIEFNDNKNLNVALENEMYLTLRINVSDIDTGEKAGAVPYKVVGRNFEDGRTIYTDENGVATISGLIIGESYTLTALSSNDYIPNSIKGDYSTSPSFNIAVTRNMDTKEVNFGVTSTVTPKFVSSSHYSYKFTMGSGSDRSFYFRNNIGNNAGQVTTIYELDLTKYYGDLKLIGKIDYSNNYDLEGSGFNLYLSDTQSKVKPFFKGKIKEELKWDFEIEKVNFDQFKFIGGKKYYLIFEANKINYAPYKMDVSWLKPTPIGSRYMLEPTEGLKDIKVGTNVTKSLLNYDVNNTNNPIVEINTKVKKTVKYDLTINKVDKSSKEPLEGALFKIEGPGFPNGGKYISTDNNGKATIELNAYLTGTIKDIPGLENGYPVDAYYTVTEVQAPLGYRTENKPIKFRYIKTYSDSNTHEDKIEYAPSENTETINEFDDYKTNDDKVDVTVGNNPIVKVIKKDADTGELLPNTYFTIEKLEYLNGLEQLTPAKSISGTILGEKITIDGKTYYAVKTDKNGSLNLNLGEGTYKLKEIKASSEKYNITDEVYYFGVGKSIGYQPAGMQMSSAEISMDRDAESGGIYVLEYLNTSDGGYIFYIFQILQKYDKNGKLEWEKDLKDLSKKTYDWNSEYIYLDGSYENSSNTSTSTIQYPDQEVIEVSDGYIVPINEAHFVKLDSKGNYLYNTQTNNPVYYKCIRDENGKYSYEYLNYYHNDRKKNKFELPNGNIGVFYIVNNSYSYNSNYKYGYILKDGTIFYESKEGKSTAVYLEYDKQGYLVKAKNITQNIYDGIESYIEENKLDKEYDYYIYDYNNPGHFIVDEDGNYLIFNLLYINNYQIQIVSKLDKNFNNIYTRPLAFYGNTITYEGEQTIEIFKDGSYIVGYRGSSYYSPEFIKPNQSNYLDSYNLTEFLNTKYNKFEGVNLVDPETGSDYSGRFAVKYNNNGEIENVVELARWRAGVATKEQEKFNRMPAHGDFPFFTYMEDGSIIAAQTYWTYDKWDEDVSSRTVYLANGDKYILPYGKSAEDHLEYNTWVIDDHHYKTMIYKINPDSSIEWVRVYEEVSLEDKSGTYNNIFLKADKNRFFMLLAKELKAKEGEDLLPSDPIDLYSTDSRFIMAEFTLSDEVTPASPESYVLDLVNKVKEFGITVMTNEGGSVVVKDGDKIIYQGSGPKEVEKVKFSADSKYDIIIKPNEGYGIVSIKVNDEDATYTVNEDGTILLDKIKNVQEAKNISIEYKKNVSRITVHHFLNGTKTRIYSDQVITGEYGTKYSVLPIDSKLYTLIKNKKGEYVFPDNYEGTFKNENQEVIFYYTPRTVKLLVSYYEEGTTNKLSETTIKEYVLGSKYIAKALNIKHYELSSVLGEEEGFINEEEIEVTYFYKALTKSKITVIYKNVEDGTEIEKKEFEVDPGSYYDTEGLSEIPEGYELKSIDGEPNGIAEYENIVVTYNYGKIKEKVEVPETVDNIIYYVIIGIISLITLILSTKYIVKRKAN